MPMALPWSFLCSLFSSLADLMLTLLGALQMGANGSAVAATHLQDSLVQNRNHSERNLIGENIGNHYIDWSNLSSQILTKLVIYITINLVCLYTKYLIDLAQRNAFLETRRSIETRAKIERENDKQERLLLSLLPRFVALEIIADIAKEDNHDKLLRNQFHKIYIHSYSNVR